MGRKIILVLEIVLRQRVVSGSLQAFKTVLELQVDKTLT